MTTAVSSTSTYSALNTTSTKEKSESEEQTDRFLTLLVEQMKNQDPLDPMDNAELTTQLAQISTVEGVEKLNDTVATMLTQIQDMQATNLVGRQVLVSGNEMTVTEGGVTGGGYELPNGADSVTIEIRNASGERIASIQQGAKEPGLQTFQWDGSIDGEAMPEGKYTFNVTGTVAGSSITPDTYRVDGVVAVSQTGSGSRLTMSSGVTLSMDAIKSVL